MALGKKHQGAKNEEGDILAVPTLSILSGGGIWETHRPRNERQNVTAEDNAALTKMSRDNYGALERFHGKRECLGQALKKE